MSDETAVRISKADPSALRVLDQASEDIEAILVKYPNIRSATLPLLFLAQSVEGYVTEDGMRDVASILGLTPAEILAVASFYTMLKKSPQGEYLISVCRNISCTHRGGRKVLQAAERRLDISAGNSTPDGKFSLEAAECLGTCDGAPSLQVNYEDFYSVTPDAMVGLIDSIERGEEIKSVAGEKVMDSRSIARETALTGSRHFRSGSAPEHKPTYGGETSPVDGGPGSAGGADDS
ncbi:MAG: NAD(P)H-dependent oxidoreductase subunit E [Actinomycetota bacterium]